MSRAFYTYSSGTCTTTILDILELQLEDQFGNRTSQEGQAPAVNLEIRPADASSDENLPQLEDQAASLNSDGIVVFSNVCIAEG